MIGLCHPLVTGCDSAFMDIWNPTSAAGPVEQHRCVSASGAPAHLLMMLDAAEHAGADLLSLRSYLVGGAGVPQSVVQRADGCGIATVRC